MNARVRVRSTSSNIDQPPFLIKCKVDRFHQHAEVYNIVFNSMNETISYETNSIFKCVPKKSLYGFIFNKECCRIECPDDIFIKHNGTWYRNGDVLRRVELGNSWPLPMTYDEVSEYFMRVCFVMRAPWPVGTSVDGLSRWRTLTSSLYNFTDTSHMDNHLRCKKDRVILTYTSHISIPSIDSNHHAIYKAITTGQILVISVHGKEGDHVMAVYGMPMVLPSCGVLWPWYDRFQLYCLESMPTLSYD